MELPTWGKSEAHGPGDALFVCGGKTLATPDTQAVCSQHRNEGFGDFVTTAKHFKG